MAKKYPRSEVIRQAQMSEEPGYISWSDEDKDKAFKAMGSAMQECRAVARPGQNHHDYSNLQTNISGRPGLNRSEYDSFRHTESIPQKRKDILSAVDDAYQRISLVRNIIDLMGDFACQGIRLTHPNKRVEKFYQNWFKKIHGKDRSERFLNTLYRLGTVIIRVQDAKINDKKRQLIMKSVASNQEITDVFQAKNSIPWVYTFINPRDVEVAGGSLASFTGDKQYEMTLPAELAKTIRSPRTQAEKDLVSKLPPEFIEASKGKGSVLLPLDKTEVFHYKKDDWRHWATPMLYASLVDLNMLDKLKLSDVAALDGAISNIRIFKLGSLDHKIAPTSAAISKLSEVLESHTGVGTFDFIWGPDIELVETSTEVHKFLGEEKYKPTLNSIYAGLGIPPTLTGTLGSSGTTNNFISLKTLIKRLQYGRDLLTEFWEKEIRKVQKAMGFRFSASIEFDNMNLGDEEAEKALWIQLADRDIISQELLQHKFGHNADMERIRINRESRDRRDGRMTSKAGPWHDPQHNQSLSKIALTSGVAAPSEVGLELKPKKEGEIRAIDSRRTPPSETKKGEPQQGRPKNSKDSEKRKPKRFTPQIKSVEIWALTAQGEISNVLHPLFLKHYGKSSLRSLTEEEHKEMENIKFGVLCHQAPLSEVTAKSIHSALHKGKVPADIESQYYDIVEQAAGSFERKLTVEETRNIQAYAYAVCRSG